MKLPLLMVLCTESPCDLINIFDPCLFSLQPWNSCKVEFTYISIPGKKAKKS